MNLSDLFIDKGSSFSNRQLKGRLNIMGVEYEKENINKQSLIALYDESVKDKNNKIKIQKELISDTNAKNKDAKQENLRRKDPIIIEISHEPKLPNRPIIQNLNITRKNIEENRFKDLISQARIKENQQQQSNIKEGFKYGNLQAKEPQDFKKADFKRDLSISNGKAYDEDFKSEKGKSLNYNNHEKGNISNQYAYNLSWQVNANIATAPDNGNIIMHKADFPNITGERRSGLIENSNNLGGAANNNYNILYNLPTNFTQNGNSQQNKWNSEERSDQIIIDNKAKISYPTNKNKINFAVSDNNPNTLSKNYDFAVNEDQLWKRNSRNTISGKGIKNLNEFDHPSNLNVNVKIEKKPRDPLPQQQIPEEFQSNNYRNQYVYNNNNNNRNSDNTLPAIKELENEDKSNSLNKDKKYDLTGYVENWNKQPSNFSSQINQNRFTDTKKNLYSNKNNQNLLGIDSINHNKRNDFRDAFNSYVNAANNYEPIRNYNPNLNSNTNVNYDYSQKEEKIPDHSGSGAFMPVEQNLLSSKRIISDNNYITTSLKDIPVLNMMIGSSSSKANKYENTNSNIYKANVVEYDNNKNNIFQQPQINLNKKPCDYIDYIENNQDQSSKSKQNTYDFPIENFHPILQEYKPLLARSSQRIQNQPSPQNPNINNIIDLNKAPIKQKQQFNSASNTNNNIQQELNYDFQNKNANAPKRFRSSAANQQKSQQNSMITIKNREDETQQSSQINMMFIDEEAKNVPFAPKANNPSAKARFEPFISEHRKIFAITFAFGIVIVSLAGLNHAQVINVRSFAERGIKIMDSLNNITLQNAIVAFYNLIRWILEFIEYILSRILRFTGASIWNNIYLIAFLILAVLLIRYIYLKVHYNRIAHEIYQKIKNRLRKLERPNLNDFRAGMRLDDVINEFSQVYRLSNNDFRDNVLTLLRELRAKDEDIRSFVEVEAGKHFEKWQFK
jgi:hypothetical protein